MAVPKSISKFMEKGLKNLLQERPVIPGFHAQRNFLKMKKSKSNI